MRPRWAPTPNPPQKRNNRQFAKAPRKHHPFHSLAACPVSVSVSISFQLRACWYLGPFGPMVLWSLGPLVALVERLVASVWATLFALCGYGKLIFMRSIYVFLLHTHSLPCVCVCVLQTRPHHDIKIVLRSATAILPSLPLSLSCHSPLQKADIANKLTVKCHELV